MLGRSTALASLVLLGSLAAPASVQAQVHLDLGPVAGFYAPTTDFQSIQPFFAPRWKQAISIAYGAQGTLWHRHLGITASYIVAPSDVKVNGSTGPNLDASIKVAALQALLALEVGDLANTVQLSAGVARVLRGGAAYRDYDGLASTALTLGVGGRFELLPRLDLDLGLSGLMYSLKLTSGATATRSSSQVDLIGRAGLMLRLL